MTDDDFDRFLQRNPLLATFTANLLITCTPVLMGYSFDDPDTRSLWALIRDRLGGLQRQGYALVLEPSTTEIARFERRGIKVVPITGNTYEDALAEVLEQLRQRYVEEVGTVAKPAEDDVAAQLILPPSVQSRLCFCSVPSALLAWYRSEVFPVVEDEGYVVVTTGDVTPPGANVAATVDALIARSRVVLIDGSSVAIHRRNDETLAQPNDLVDEIRKRLRGVAVPEVSQPRELLDQGHASAAVVVALGLLEEELIGHLEASRPERPPGLGRLLEAAADVGLITEDDRRKTHAWIRLRNSVVHQGNSIKPATARGLVSHVEMLLSRLAEMP